MQPEKLENIKRILAIGDIHGCYVAFAALLDAVQPGPDDLVITLGDYIDRGPDARKVVERLIQLHENLPAVSLKGNHEEMVLEWRDKNYDKTLLWWANGGLATLRSYCRGDDKWLTRMFWQSFIPSQSLEYHNKACSLIPPAHWKFFENCRDWYEMGDWIFIHGQVDPSLPLAEQSNRKLRWSRFNKSQKAHISGKKVVCGHTPQADGMLADIGHTICIDTYLYGGGWLTCLDAKNKIYYQANTLGQTRIIGSNLKSSD